MLELWGPGALFSCGEGGGGDGELVLECVQFLILLFIYYLILPNWGCANVTTGGFGSLWVYSIQQLPGQSTIPGGLFNTI